MFYNYNTEKNVTFPLLFSDSSHYIYSMVLNIIQRHKIISPFSDNFKSTEQKKLFFWFLTFFSLRSSFRVETFKNAMKRKWILSPTTYYRMNTILYFIQCRIAFQGIASDTDFRYSTDSRKGTFSNLKHSIGKVLISHIICLSLDVKTFLKTLHYTINFKYHNI